MRCSLRLTFGQRLANYVLLYYQIVIPTGNLQILPVLRLMLGEGAFDDLVHNKGIVLARFDQCRSASMCANSALGMSLSFTANWKCDYTQ